MFDVKHLCPHYILIDSIELVIIYIDILHDYQKEAFVLYYAQDESCAAFPLKSKQLISANCFMKAANTGHLENIDACDGFYKKNGSGKQT
jgi:hypothetical protein